MKAKDWQSTAKLIRERQNQAATADSSKLSSFPLSELPVHESYHMCPYLQAHLFACHKVISKQWIVHQMNPLFDR